MPFSLHCSQVVHRIGLDTRKAGVSVNWRNRAKTDLRLWIPSSADRVHAVF
jgi:hypothetical protein